MAAHTRRVTRDPKMPTGNLLVPPGVWAKVRPSTRPFQFHCRSCIPHAQGFIAATSVELAGKVGVPWAGQARPVWPALPVLWLWKLEQIDSYPT